MTFLEAISCLLLGFIGGMVSNFVFRDRTRQEGRERLLEEIAEEIGLDEPDDEAGFVPDPSDEEYEELTKPMMARLRRETRERVRRQLKNKPGQ